MVMTGLYPNLSRHVLVGWLTDVSMRWLMDDGGEQVVSNQYLADPSANQGLGEGAAADPERLAPVPAIHASTVLDLATV